MCKLFVSLLSISLLFPGVRAANSASEDWMPLAKTIQKSDNDKRQYQGIKLDNGMKVLLVSDPLASKSLAALALPVGSLQDPSHQQGLAHYLEHMLLMGSKNYPAPDDFSEYLNKHAGSYNASTAPYRTAFYLEVANGAFKPAVERLAGAIAEPLLDPIYADRERHAVNAELTMARSRDGMRMGQVDAETINPAHPASQFFGGNLTTLSDKPGSKLQDELNAFYLRYYSANLMVGVLYSQQSLPELALLANDTFGRIKNRQAKYPTISVPAVTEKEEGILIHYIPAQPKKMLLIDFRITDDSSEFRNKAYRYISYLLTNRSENTLSDWLQKEGLADTIDSSSQPKSEGNSGVFRISISLTDKGIIQRDRIIAATFSYLTLLRNQGIRQDYFDELSRMLALNFRYLSITRDMSYVEWLSDTLLQTPIEHVLNSHFLADQYDAATIATKLDQMVPKAARIWYISPNEPTDKKAYFFDASYQVEKITDSLFKLWRDSDAQTVLALPMLNPYIPNNFDLIKVNKRQIKPEWGINQPGLRVLQMPSRYFGDEPKVSVIVALRNKSALNSSRNQVLFALTDYIAALKRAQLIDQMSIGGVYFSTSANHGLQLTIEGFSQRMLPLFNTLIEQYRDFVPTNDELEQAKSWYQETLAAIDQARAYELAVQPTLLLSSTVPYFEQDERLQQLTTISLEEIIRYRSQLFNDSAIEMISIGNLTPAQVKSMALALTERLSYNALDWWHGETIRIDKMMTANLTRFGASTDSALAAFYVPLGYSELASMAYSRVLTQIIQPWFYHQLRTEEQLGYALFAIPIPLGKQWGINFILQTNAQSPAYLYQRYQLFFTNTEKRLSSLTDADIEQYKQSIIHEIAQRPQTLEEEAERYLADFNRSNHLFDSREALLSEIKAITKNDLYRYFKQAVITQNGLSMLSQIMKKNENSQHDEKRIEKKAVDYANPVNWVFYKNTAALQKTLVRQVNP